MPQMQFSTEVLPAPLGPMSARSSPLFARSETLRSTDRPPKESETLSRSRSAIPASAAAVLLDITVATPLRRSGAEIELADVLVRTQLLRRAVQHHAAVLHHIPVVRDFERHLRVLLDDEQREAEAVAHVAQASHQLADHEWREAEGELIHQQQPRRAHQRRADTEHLALA